VDPQVSRITSSQRHVFGDLGCRMDKCAPDFSDTNELFNELRAWGFVLKITGISGWQVTLCATG